MHSVHNPFVLEKPKLFASDFKEKNDIMLQERN